MPTGVIGCTKHRRPPRTQRCQFGEDAPQFGLVRHTEADPADIGLVHATLGELHGERVTEFGRRDDRAVGIADHALRADRQAVAGQQAGDVPRRQPIGAGRQRPDDQRLGLVFVDTGGTGHRRHRRVAQPGIPPGCPQSRGRRFREGEHGHHSVRTDDRDGALLAADPGDDHRFVRRGHRRRRGDTAHHLVGVRDRGIGEHRQHGVDLGSIEQQAQRGVHLRGSHPAAQVDRVAAGRRGRNCLSQLLFGLGSQRHHVQAGANGGVGGENARTAGIADHRDAVPAR